MVSVCDIESFAWWLRRPRSECGAAEGEDRSATVVRTVVLLLRCAF